MLSSETLSIVALVSTDVSEELIVSIIRVMRVSGQGKMIAVTSNRYMLRRNISVNILC
jgi:hypothetical protein